MTPSDVLRYPNEDPRVVLTGRVDAPCPQYGVPMVALDAPAGALCGNLPSRDELKVGDRAMLRGLLWEKA